MLEWLLGAALGPAAVALPVNWAAEALAGVAQRWFRRLRRTDDLSRLVRAAIGTSFDLTPAEFAVVRKLLEDQQTWTLLGRGTVDDLADRIADCLPSRDGRTAEDSHAAALTVARGLLEFAVADLDPKLFQQVLMARLQRIETGQASGLDEALLGLHARFASVMEQLKQVLDRLPPGPAGRGEIAVYLRTLIDWLDTDPWPRDLGGSVLTPAAIERKLRVTTTGRAHEQDLDADTLAQQCRRLVILGGPGSGKTWLARRTARRCAEEALEALAAGQSLDEADLPLYTTCARLFGSVGDIRNAVVSSALDQLPDLGGSRISAALRVFFTERNGPTLLIIDSLDEAHGPSERLRQAGTLPWRIVLTSRPSSWRDQLAINDTEDSHRVGELQPLRYPEDVEPFIQCWFNGQPERGQDVCAQIAQRPGLRQGATVPLILAFYCIVGGSGPLPEFRRDLYTKVVRRMLTGRWRRDDDRQPDADACLQTLRAWAWSGAANDHPVSGVGTWTDDIPTGQIRLGEAEVDALDHVATHLGPPDVDTGQTLRRFIHRSIREHFVAEYVAGLPADEAVRVLLPHLWYDSDWEYVAPAALAMHPQHDQLMRDLICRAASLDEIPGELSVIDAGWEFRGLLARVAGESSEDDWSPGVGAMIGRARVELARSARTDDLGGAASWGSSNREARDALLSLLARETSGWVARGLAGGVVQLAATAEDRRHAREALLGLLAHASDSWLAEELAGAVVQLAAAEEERRQAREALLGLLADQTSGSTAGMLAGVVVQLDPTAEDKRQAREALLGLLAHATDSWVAYRLAGAVVQLAVTEEEKRQAREALLGLLADQTSGSIAGMLAGVVVQLDPTAQEKRQARETLLGLLAYVKEFEMEPLASVVVQLGPTAEEMRQAREALLGLLTRATYGPVAAGLAGVVVQLDPTGEEKRQAREALLGLLAYMDEFDVETEVETLAGGVVKLAATAEEKRQARDALLGLLTGTTSGPVAGMLADVVIQLDPTAEDKRQVRDALLGLLTRDAWGSGPSWLAAGVVQLDPTAEDRRQARDALLGLLTRETNKWVAGRLTDVMVHLEPTVHNLRTWHGWAVRPTAELLAAVRRNSALTDWLAALSSLTSLSGSPT